MKYSLLYILLLAALKNANGQDSIRTLRAFAEAGIGYSYQFDKPDLSKDPEQKYIGSADFSKGITSNLHFGVLLAKRANLGIAARCGYSFYPKSDDEAGNFFHSLNPKSNTIIQYKKHYSSRYLEMGPIFGFSVKKLTFDGEILLGMSSLTVPYLFIRSVVDDGYSPFLYRPSQRIRFATLTMSMGARYQYSQGKYCFFRVDALGNSGNETPVLYDRYPDLTNGSGNSYKPEYLIDEFAVANFLAGLGILIR